MKMTGIWTSTRVPADIQHSFDCTTPELAALVFGAETPKSVTQTQQASPVGPLFGAVLFRRRRREAPHRDLGQILLPREQWRGLSPKLLVEVLQHDRAGDLHRSRRCQRSERTLTERPAPEDQVAEVEVQS